MVTIFRILLFVGLCRQVVTCIPTKRVPKELSFGTVTQEEIEEEEDVVDDANLRGQMLWIRGLSRLQHQVSRLFSITFTRLYFLVWCAGKNITDDTLDSRPGRSKIQQPTFHPSTHPPSLISRITLFIGSSSETGSGISIMVTDNPEVPISRFISVIPMQPNIRMVILYYYCQAFQ